MFGLFSSKSNSFGAHDFPKGSFIAGIANLDDRIIIILEARKMIEKVEIDRASRINI